MTKEKKTDEQKLQDQLRVIADLTGRNLAWRLKQSDLGISQLDSEYGPRTLLKLAFLNYYLGVFLTIAQSYKGNGMFDNIVFLDAFGGSGLVKIRGSQYNVIGSSLLAATEGRFDQVISLELDKEKANLLRKRCQALGLSKVHVIQGDTNDVVPSIPSKFRINDKSIILLFIDPEGMEPEFSKFIPLTEATKHIDFMLNYAFGVNRLAGRIEKHMKDADLERMRKMIPNYQVGSDPDELLLRYFEDQFGKPYGHRVDVHSIGDKIEYSMILRVRKTLSGSPWVKNSMESFGDILSSLDGQRALKSLEIVKGRQITL